AFPAIGTGVGGLPVAESARRMSGVAAEFLGSASGHLEKIEYVLFDDRDFQTFANEVENVWP
ncbi:MAG: hypothetical protein VCF07_16810, partial [Nitrospinota bacterium]